MSHFLSEEDFKIFEILHFRSHVSEWNNNQRVDLKHARSTGYSTLYSNRQEAFSLSWEAIVSGGFFGIALERFCRPPEIR